MPRLPRASLAGRESDVKFSDLFSAIFETKKKMVTLQAPAAAPGPVTSVGELYDAIGYGTFHFKLLAARTQCPHNQGFFAKVENT